jgi:hypothetical protein
MADIDTTVFPACKEIPCAAVRTLLILLLQGGQFETEPLEAQTRG